MTHVDQQLRRLAEAYPNSTARQLGDGSQLITVRDVAIDGGAWNKERITAHFVAPVGYPLSRPDCFWTDADLRLRNGTVPKNSGVQVPPFSAEPLLWFSWHASSWRPNSDDLLTYMRVILDRLAHAE